jgi:hypothetical protein
MTDHPTWEQNQGGFSDSPEKGIQIPHISPLLSKEFRRTFRELRQILPNSTILPPRRHKKSTTDIPVRPEPRKTLVYDGHSCPSGILQAAVFSHPRNWRGSAELNVCADRVASELLVGNAGLRYEPSTGC